MDSLLRTEQTAADIVIAVGNTIRDLGEVPSGHLYARLMGHMDIHGYNAIIAMLKRAGLIEEKNYLLRWIRPKV